MNTIITIDSWGTPMNTLTLTPSDERYDCVDLRIGNESVRVKIAELETVLSMIRQHQQQKRKP